MKICFVYPPLKGPGTPTLSGNRQFQWFSSPTYIYPVMMATWATQLKNEGHEVYWLDGIAEKLSFLDFWKRVSEFMPDKIIVETKYPVHDLICKSLNYFPSSIEKEIVGDCAEKIPVFRDPPVIDRQLTKWRLYANNNGNFIKTPGAYTMFGRDCWYGKCTFCSWAHNLFPATDYSVCSVDTALAEVENLISLGVKTIFDDSGSFPRGEWLHNFCKGVIKNGWHKKVEFGCNLRFTGYTDEDIKLLGRASFQFALLGLESASEETLRHLNKGCKRTDVEKVLRQLRRARISTHITTMFGYPWENEDDAKKTVSLCRSFFARGLITSLQATLIVPYPGTPLYETAKEYGWLLTERAEDYDMRTQVLACSYDPFKYIRKAYMSWAQPSVILRALARPSFLMRAVPKVIGHLKDFGRR